MWAFFTISEIINRLIKNEINHYILNCTQRSLMYPNRTPHTPTHTYTKHTSLQDFAPPLKHGHFSLGTTSPCELTHRSVTTHNLVQTHQIFPYIVTPGSDLTTFHECTQLGNRGKLKLG